MTGTLLIGVYVFVLASFVGFEIINKVPPTLHTPLMSGSNAISGITICGALLAAGSQHAAWVSVLGFLAVVLAMTLPASIFSRVLFSWSALGAAFGPILFARVAGVEPKPMAILIAITAGFFTTVLFYIYGQIGGDSLLARLPALPGDPFERIFPWLVPLVLVFVWRQSRRTGSSPDS